MSVEIRRFEADALDLYAQVPSSFLVDSILQVDLIDNGLGGMLLREEPVAVPYCKDYDAHGERPPDWAHQFDVRNWGFFLALDGPRPVGGAAVAWKTPGVHMLAGRADMAVLWDIRVHPDWHRQRIGTALVRHAAEWARRQGATLLKIETQNVNVRACRFYHQQGCRLGEIDRYGYAAHPHVAHETMLIWYLDLVGAAGQGAR